MSEHRNVVGPATGLELLTVLFIGLKLTGHVAWPWSWVLAPIWVPIVLVIFVGLLYALFKVIFE